MSLAELLRERPEADWRVAAACGIHPAALSLYKTGRRPIGDRHARALAEYLEVDVAAIRQSGPGPIGPDEMAELEMAVGFDRSVDDPDPEMGPDTWVE